MIVFLLLHGFLYHAYWLSHGGATYRSTAYLCAPCPNVVSDLRQATTGRDILHVNRVPTVLTRARALELVLTKARELLLTHVPGAPCESALACLHAHRHVTEMRVYAR